jgi:hypothetical protein
MITLDISNCANHPLRSQQDHHIGFALHGGALSLDVKACSCIKITSPKVTGTETHNGSSLPGELKIGSVSRKFLKNRSSSIDLPCGLKNLSLIVKTNRSQFILEGRGDQETTNFAQDVELSRGVGILANSDKCSTENLPVSAALQLSH